MLKLTFLSAAGTLRTAVAGSEQTVTIPMPQCLHSWLAWKQNNQSKEWHDDLAFWMWNCFGVRKENLLQIQTIEKSAISDVSFDLTTLITAWRCDVILKLKLAQRIRCKPNSNKLSNCPREQTVNLPIKNLIVHGQKKSLLLMLSKDSCNILFGKKMTNINQKNVARNKLCQMLELWSWPLQEFCMGCCRVEEKSHFVTDALFTVVVGGTVVCAIVMNHVNDNFLNPVLQQQQKCK